MRTVFANGPGDWGLIPGQVIPKTHNKHDKVRIKGKEEQSWEWSRALPYTSV